MGADDGDPLAGFQGFCPVKGNWQGISRAFALNA